MTCGRRRRHEFDYLSGYCVHCGRERDDGRQVGFYGNVTAEGPTYTPAEIADLTQRAEMITARRYPARPHV